MNTGLFLTGMGAGALVGYFFDPETGRRHRARAADAAVHACCVLWDATLTTSRDAANRARGIAAELRAAIQEAEAGDEVLAERVRAALGRVTSHPHAITVDARNGHVVLTGAILAHEVSQVLAAVERVRGVTGVEDRLEHHEQRDGVPSLQGGQSRQAVRFELMQEYWSPTARCLVGTTGGAVAVLGLLRRDAWGAAMAATGTAFALRAATNLPLARVVGAGAGRRAVDVQKTIRIEAPVEEVFGFWSKYENFPAFMTHVREVRPTAVDGQTHWIVEGPGGLLVEFDTVLTDLRPNEVLAWKTVEGAAVQHAGIVRFERIDAGATRVTVRMSYNPPAGAVGHAVVSLVGADPKRQLDDDLLRMKTFIETGRRPRDAAHVGP